MRVSARQRCHHSGGRIVSILQDKIAKYIEYLGVSIAKLAGSKTIYKYPFSPMGLVTLKKHLADFGAGGATWGSCRVRRP